MASRIQGGGGRRVVSLMVDRLFGLDGMMKAGWDDDGSRLRGSRSTRMRLDSSPGVRIDRGLDVIDDPTSWGEDDPKVGLSKSNQIKMIRSRWVVMRMVIESR